MKRACRATGADSENNPGETPHSDLGPLFDDPAKSENHTVLGDAGAVLLQGLAVLKVAQRLRVVGAHQGKVEFIEHPSAGLQPVLLRLELVRLDERLGGAVASAIPGKPLGS
jgi:hypothetical protein